MKVVCSTYTVYRYIAINNIFYIKSGYPYNYTLHCNNRASAIKSGCIKDCLNKCAYVRSYSSHLFVFLPLEFLTKQF